MHVWFKRCVPQTSASQPHKLRGVMCNACLMQGVCVKDKQARLPKLRTRSALHVWFKTCLFQRQASKISQAEGCDPQCTIGLEMCLKHQQAKPCKLRGVICDAGCCTTSTTSTTRSTPCPPLQDWPSTHSTGFCRYTSFHCKETWSYVCI